MQKELGLGSELKTGPSGSFQVLVDGKVVAEKELFGFPTEEEIVAAVRSELAS